MATQEKKFKKKKLFQVVRELNVSQDRVVEFLEDRGYADALSGSGLNAKITDEEAYLVLREEYADDAEAAARIRELRQERDESVAGDGQDETVPAAPEAAAPEAPEAAAADTADATASDATASEDAADESPTDAQADQADTQVNPAEDTQADAAETAEHDAAEHDAADSQAETAEAEADAETAEAPEDSAEAPRTDAAQDEEPAADHAPTHADSGPVSETTDGDAAAEPVPPAEADSVDATAAEEAPVAEPSDATAEEETEEAPAEATAGGTVPDEEASTAEADDAKADDADGTATADAAAQEATAESVSPEDSDGAKAEDATAPSGEAEASSEDEVPSAETEVPESKADADATADAEGDAEADRGVEASETELAQAKADVSSPDQEDIESVDTASEEEKEETLKANRYRLSGTQVVGKVDLDKLRRPKRKRKRKKKKKEEEKKKQQKKKDRKRKERKKKRRKKKRRKKKRGVDEEDVEQTIQETLQELEQGASRARQRRRRRRRERHERERQKRREKKKEQEDVLRVTEYITTGELANLMGEPVKEVIRTLFDAGMMVSINQRLDRDTVEFVAEEYDLEVQFIDEFSGTSLQIREDDPEDLRPRAPVVTVMGHVDHGKTSLLDYIRNANVVAGEEGGITQHIGAHYVELTDFDDEAVTFLDTPGHEAFTAMRARGAKATDMVILVVAADDSVMPQTIEAINHAQAADVPIVVAINKMDLSEADPQRVMAELAEHNVLVEQYGGNVQVAEVSAETGQGIDDLMEKVILQAEIMELKANPNREADGVVIESRLEKGRGNVITVLVQNGTLEVGDPFVAGIYSGRVRAMFDERDQRIEEVGPAHPALILGCNGSPEVGDQFAVLDDEGVARDIAQERQRIHREQELRRKSQVSLDQVSRRMAAGDFQELNLIVKADVGGSVEALSDALLKLKTDEVAVNIIHSGVGAITESDVMLARASEAVIIGFQVRPTTGARKTAEREEIDIRTYSIIYDAIEDVHDALEGLLSPEEREETKGRAEVRDTFKVPGVGTIGGCYVTDGTLSRNHKVRLIRDGVVVYEGEIESLKRFKDDVKEVQSGYECGVGIANFNDLKVGDEIESYIVIEEKRTLEVQ